MDRERAFVWIKKKYGIEPDYPWNDDTAVLRHRCFASSDRYNKLKSLYSSALADFFMSILLNFFVVFYCVSRETMI